MGIVELREILFSHSEMAEFRQYRIREDIDAGTKSRFSLPVPYNYVWFIYRYKFGDIAVNTFNLNWEAVRNARTEVILLGTEHLNFDTKPIPYLIAKNTSGTVVVENTNAATRTFEMTLDVCEIHETMIKEIEKILGWVFKV